MKLDSSFLLLISDSHGGTASLATVLEWTQSAMCTHTFDAAVFLGDGFADLAPASACTGFPLSWHSVRGNGDYQSNIDDSKVLEIPGKNPAQRSSRRLFLSHGSRYRVEDGITSIAAAARSAGAEAALFGHTHVPYCAVVDGIFLINPGSVSRPRSKIGCTFAVLECPDSGPLAARFFNLTGLNPPNQCREITVKV